MSLVSRLTDDKPTATDRRGSFAALSLLMQRGSCACPGRIRHHRTEAACSRLARSGPAAASLCLLSCQAIHYVRSLAGVRPVEARRSRGSPVAQWRLHEHPPFSVSPLPARTMNFVAENRIVPPTRQNDSRPVRQPPQPAKRRRMPRRRLSRTVKQAHPTSACSFARPVSHATPLGLNVYHQRQPLFSSRRPHELVIYQIVPRH